MPTYNFWKVWLDDKGRTWAEPYYSDVPSAARQAHDAAKTFRWAEPGQRERVVTELHGFDGRVNAVVAEGARQDSDPIVGRTQSFYERDE